ncbi:unnamed protein product [Ixodes pacificus]
MPRTSTDAGLSTLLYEYIVQSEQARSNSVLVLSASKTYTLPEKKLFGGLNRGLGRLARQHIFVSPLDVRRTKERNTQHGYQVSRVRFFFGGYSHSYQRLSAQCTKLSRAKWCKQKNKQKHSEQILGFHL